MVSFFRSFSDLFTFNSMGFSDAETERHYMEWQKPAQVNQIGAISILTGLLYLANSGINYYTAPVDILSKMLAIHILLVPPILFLVAFLALRTRFYKSTILLLMIAPLIANAASFVIHSHFGGITTHLTENYLSLLWIFIVTGLTLFYATISALLTFGIVLYLSLFVVNFTRVELVYHIFWMLCSISFGLLGGYLLERGRRSNFLVHMQLEALAVRDHLTGLFNRNRLNEVLPKELDRNRRFNHSLGIMMLDLDHFKRVNDTFGHKVGDRVLVALAELFLQNTRSTDSVFRWGGEEFLIISPEINEAGIMALAENLREKIAGYSFPVIDRSSISIGVTVSQPDDSPGQIIERVDKALYQAKEQGRNRVIFSN